MLGLASRPASAVAQQMCSQFLPRSSRCATSDGRSWRPASTAFQSKARTSGSSDVFETIRGRWDYARPTYLARLHLGTRARPIYPSLHIAISVEIAAGAGRIRCSSLGIPSCFSVTTAYSSAGQRDTLNTNRRRGRKPMMPWWDRGLVSSLHNARISTGESSFANGGSCDLHAACRDPALNDAAAGRQIKRGPERAGNWCSGSQTGHSRSPISS